MKLATAMLFLSSLRFGAAFMPAGRSSVIARQLATIRPLANSAAAPRARHLTTAMAAGASTAAPSVKPLSTPADLLNDVDVFIFDCDGVIWRGDSLIEKVPAVLEKLRQQGKR